VRVFDSHLHIIDPRFPLVPNRGYVPDAFTAADYRTRADALGAAGVTVVGGAVVSGSFQASDQTYLVDALRALGPAFVGVTQIPPSTPDVELLALDRAGVRAVRFNLERGGSAGLADLDAVARRVHAVAGWHVELYVNGRDLPDLVPVLAGLPAVVVDHLGLTRAGVPTLLRLAERGARVKATGFGRLDFAPGPVLRDLARANPDALLFGTDLPSTRAPRPFRAEDVAAVRDALEPLGPDLAAKALYHNAVALYRPRALRVADRP
jgi:predicted TIM-barrel fold metal-dependent hydrolase